MDKNIPITISKRFKALRMEKGCSQKYIAKELGVSASAVSQWESGLHPPVTHTVIEIAEYFHVSVDYLIGRKDNR